MKLTRRNLWTPCTSALECLSLKQLRSLLRSRGVSVEQRLRVTNLTRKTLLADKIAFANTGKLRRKGLLGRQQLEQGEGLWIAPCEAVHTVGMRFSIDLIYLDHEYRVVKLRGDVRPWKLSVCLAAHSVLELRSGTIRELKTCVGDALALEFV